MEGQDLTFCDQIGLEAGFSDKDKITSKGLGGQVSAFVLLRVESLRDGPGTGDIIQEQISAGHLRGRSAFQGGGPLEEHKYLMSC